MYRLASPARSRALAPRRAAAAAAAPLRPPAAAERVILVCCPTSNVTQFCALLCAKLWWLWPRLRVVVLHHGGAQGEAKLMRELGKSMLLEHLLLREHTCLLYTSPSPRDS